MVTALEPGAEDVYWCTKDSEEWAKDYFARIGTNFTGELSRLQWLARRHFYGALPSSFIGDMPSSAEVTRAGDQGENVELRVNWLRAHANAKHQIIVAPKLTWGTHATNTDARSLADAARGASILEYMWKTGVFEQKATAAALGAIINAEDFLFTYFNAKGGKEKSYNEQSGEITYEGDIDCFSIPSWDVLRDVSASSFDESAWRSVRRDVSRHKLIALYPEMKAQILAAPSVASPSRRYGSEGISVASTDKVSCHYFFHSKQPELPLGLQAVLLSTDCVLEFEPLAKCYQTWPITRFHAADLMGTPFAYTSFWEAMAAQDLATDIQGSLATNIVTFGKQMISAEADQNLPVDQIGNGPAVMYRPKGSQPPTPLMLASSPPEAFKHLENIKSDQRMILGLNDMAMGEPPQGPPNAQAWALLSTANITNNSGEQRNYVNAVRNVGRSILAIVKEKYSDKRKALIVGVHGASVPKQETYDKTDFAGIEDATVEIDNPLMQNAAGRLQIATMHIDRGFVQVPEQLEQLITTGSAEPLTQTLRDELVYIAWENERLLESEQLPVMITDSHQMHIREHKAVTYSSEARTTPGIIEAANAHIQQHIQMALETDPRILALLGQAAPQAPMPPEGAPVDPTASPKKDSPAAVMEQPGAGPGAEAADINAPKLLADPAAGGALQ